MREEDKEKKKKEKKREQEQEKRSQEKKWKLKKCKSAPLVRASRRKRPINPRASGPTGRSQSPFISDDSPCLVLCYIA